MLCYWKQHGDDGLNAWENEPSNENVDDAFVARVKFYWNIIDESFHKLYFVS